MKTKEAKVLIIFTYSLVGIIKFVLSEPQNDCDQYIKTILAQQNVSAECDQFNNFIIDGKNQTISIELILKDRTSSTSQISFFNFKQLNFSKVILESFNRNSQQNVFLNISNNELVVFEDILVKSETESNIQYFQIYNNENLLINNLNILFLNGYSPLVDPQLLKQQTIVSLQNNIFTQIDNYQLDYSQRDEPFQEYQGITGIYSINNTMNIQNFNLQLNFTKYKLEQQIDLLLNPLNINNYKDNKIIFLNINMQVFSLLDIFGYLQQSSLIQLSCADLSQSLCGVIEIGDINIQNQNFVLNLIGLINQDKVTIQNLNVVKLGLNDTTILNSLDTVKGIMGVGSYINELTINNINVTDAFNFQFYYVIYLKCNNNNMKISIGAANIYNSYWSNTMFYFYNDSLSYLNIFLRMQNSSYQGVGPLLFINVNTVIFSVDLQINKSIKTDHGLVWVDNSNDICIFKDSKVLIHQNTKSFYLGKGGLFVFYYVPNLRIINSTFESLTDSIHSSQIGGLFQVLMGDQVQLFNITASGFKINGQGSFAHIEAFNIIIEQCMFDRFYSGGSGGTLMVVYKGYLEINDVKISNSEAGLFGGGLYAFNQQEDKYQHNIRKLSFENTIARIGGALVLNHNGQELSNITFVNTKACAYNETDTISQPLSSINIISYGEYNPELIGKQQNITLNYTQIKDKQQISSALFSFEIQIFHYVIFTLDFGYRNFSYSDLFPEQNQQKSTQNNLLNLKERDRELVQQNIVSKNLQYLFYTFPGNQEYQVNPNTLLLQYQPTLANYLSSIQLNVTDFYLVINLKNFYSELQLHFQGLFTLFKLYRLEQCEYGQVSINTYPQRFAYCQQFQAIKFSNQNCSKCDYSMFKNCSGNITIVQKGYYRQSLENLNLSSYYQQNGPHITNSEDEQLAFKITFNPLQCPIPENCDGEDEYGNDLCLKSHIGPFCLECDRKGEKWGSFGIFTRSISFECNDCYTYEINLLMIIISGILAICLISIFDLVLCLQFRSKNKNVDLKQKISPSFHLKLILFFLQITNVCSFYRSPQLLKVFFDYSAYVYNPLSSSFFNFLECFIIQAFPNLSSAPHVLVLVQAILPFCFIFSNLLIRALVIQVILYRSKKNENQQQTEVQESLLNDDNKSKKDKNEKQKINQKEQNSVLLGYFCNINFTIQLFLFSINAFSFYVIQSLIAGVSCIDFEQLGNYSNLDFTISCNNPSRMDLVYAMYAFLIIYAFLLSGFFIQLFNNRNNLKNKNLEQKYGFLYQEYKQKYFFWEFIRLLVKILILLSTKSIVPNSNKFGYYVIAILIAYMGILYQFQPYLLDHDIPQHHSQFLNYKFFFSHTNREITIILSGIFIIFCYMLNALSFSYGYYNENDFSPQFIAFSGHFQAFISLLIITLILLKYIIYHRIKKCCRRKQENTPQQQQ